jgi:hypothetical protein
LQCSRLFFALKAKRQSRARTSDFVALDALRRFCPLAGVEEGTPARQSKTKKFLLFSFALLSFIRTFAIGSAAGLCAAGWDVEFARAYLIYIMCDGFR